MKKGLIIIFSILYSLQTYAQEMNQYKGDGLTMSYPANWESMSHPRTKFVFLRPLEEEGQMFRENIILIVSDNKGLTLDEYVGFCKVQLNKQLSNYKLFSTNKITIEGNTYSELIYQHSSDSTDYQVLLCVFIIDGKAYEFTCSALKDTFNKFMPLFNKMINSLNFSN